MKKRDIIAMISVAIVLLAIVICNIGMFLSVRSMTKRLEASDKEVQQAANEPEEKLPGNWEPTDDENAGGENTPADDMIKKADVKAYFDADGKGTLAMLRDFFPEYVIFRDVDYQFVEIKDSLKKNSFVQKNFIRDDKGFLTYQEKNTIISYKGIDVSRYQGNINWKEVKEDEIDYAMIRLGYRGYGTGQIVEDECAKANLAGANEAGIKAGVYFFSQAVTKEEAVEEAEYVLDMIKKYKIDYPVVFDTEEISGDTSRTETLTAKERTDIAIAFCERIKDAGYTPMIYANIKWFTTALELERLEAYDKWFAYYDDVLYFPYHICMWQYADSGKVAGIAGNVDINISFQDYTASRK